MYAQVSAIGHYLPERVVNNEELAERFKDHDLNGASGIYKRTGIKERRYAKEGMTTTDLVCKSITNLLENSSLNINDIECIIVGTLTPDYFFPSTAVSAINQLNARNAWGFDLSAACSGFCYGLGVAISMVEHGRLKNVIVCGAEKMSATLNNFDYKTGILFGDGAGAVLIEPSRSADFSFKGALCKVKADDLTDVYFKTPFNATNWQNEKFELDGLKVYKHGVAFSVALINEYLNKAGKTLDDFDYIVPHQANGRMLSDIINKLNIDKNKLLTNIEYIGNTGGASIPICLSDKYQEGKLKKGDRLLLCSFGAGYTTSVIELNWSL